MNGYPRVLHVDHILSLWITDGQVKGLNTYGISLWHLKTDHGLKL